MSTEITSLHQQQQRTIRTHRMCAVQRCGLLLQLWSGLRNPAKQLDRPSCRSRCGLGSNGRNHVHVMSRIRWTPGSSARHLYFGDLLNFETLCIRRAFKNHSQRICLAISRSFFDACKLEQFWLCPQPLLTWHLVITISTQLNSTLF